MYVDAQTILTVSGVVGAVLAIGSLIYKAIKWFQTQEEQTKQIEELRNKEQEDINNVKEELCLLMYANLACLKGLKEQGCNGPVTEAIDKIEKHLNIKAHGQDT